MKSTIANAYCILGLVCKKRRILASQFMSSRTGTLFEISSATRTKLQPPAGRDRSCKNSPLNINNLFSY